MNPPPYLWVFLVFSSLAIVGFFLFGLTSALRRAHSSLSPKAVRTAGVVLFAWLGLSIALGSAGLYRARINETFPVILLAVGLPILIGSIALNRSTAVQRILQAVPPSWLIGFQVYRSLGALFLLLNGLALMPAAFALPAGFGDVFVGITAIGVAALVAAGSPLSRRLAQLWNWLGILDLVIALACGFLTAPGRFQTLALAQPNYLVAQYPIVLIPIFLVPRSIILHLASLKQLRDETSPDPRRAERSPVPA